MEISVYLKQLREERAFSQRQLALYSGVSNTTISRIEAGDAMPDAETLKKLAQGLKINPQTLFEACGYIETDDPTPPSESPIYDEEAWALMEEMHKRPELKTLFSTTKNVKKEDIELIDKMIKNFAGYDDETFD